MATHSSILAWRISWTGEPGGLQSTGFQKVGHDRATNTFTFFQFSLVFSLLFLAVEGEGAPTLSSASMFRFWG